MEITLENNNKPWFYKVKKSDEIFNSKTESGENFFYFENFAKKFNFELEDFKKLNGNIKQIKGGDILIIPPSSKYCHVVMPTETLETISKKFGVSKEEIISKNNVTKIFIGQKLFL